MNIKKLLLWSLLLCVNIIVLTSCGKKIEEVSDEVIVHTKDEVFELKLYLEKASYAADEIINCYATVEYIGEEENITVYSGNPLVGFGLKDDKYFDGDYATEDILMPTTFHKGEIETYHFTKSGGWGSADPNASFYEGFYSDKDLVLPVGEYELSASINYSLDQEDVIGTQFTTKVTTSIVVKQ